MNTAECPMCDNKINISDFNDHLIQIHNFTKLQENAEYSIHYNCRIDSCILDFKTPPELKKHQTSIHRTYVPRPVASYKCEIDNCGGEFKTISAIKNHQSRIHCDNKCSVCDYCGTTKFDLEKHETWTHGIYHNITFKCNINDCDISFDKIQDIKLHQLFYHKDCCPKSDIAADYVPSDDDFDF